MTLMTFVYLIAGLVLLVAGAEVLVRGAAKLAAQFGIPPLIIGLTVVAFGTSAPETAVSVQAALDGSGDLAIGNVVGSNIANVLFILGLTALIAPLIVSRQLIRLDVPIMIGASLLTFALAWDGSLSKLGSGTLTLSGISDLTGDTNVNAGTLQVNGSLASGNVLVVVVEERPSIADVDFAGAREFDKDALLKALKQLRQDGGRHAHALVRHPDSNTCRGRRRTRFWLQGPHLEQHRALLTELERVRHQVEHDLLDPGTVSHHPAGQRRILTDIEYQSLLECDRAHECVDIRHQRWKKGALGFERHLAGL